jgi:hypothetical protein
MSTPVAQKRYNHQATCSKLSVSKKVYVINVVRHPCAQRLGWVKKKGIKNNPSLAKKKYVRMIRSIELCGADKSEELVGGRTEVRSMRGGSFVPHT